MTPEARAEKLGNDLAREFERVIMGKPPNVGAGHALILAFARQEREAGDRYMEGFNAGKTFATLEADALLAECEKALEDYDHASYYEPISHFEQRQERFAALLAKLKETRGAATATDPKEGMNFLITGEQAIRDDWQPVLPERRKGEVGCCFTPHRRRSTDSISQTVLTTEVIAAAQGGWSRKKGIEVLMRNGYGFTREQAEALLPQEPVPAPARSTDRERRCTCGVIDSDYFHRKDGPCLLNRRSGRERRCCPQGTWDQHGRTRCLNDRRSGNERRKA